MRGGIVKKALELFEAWYSHLPVHKSSGGPAKGTMSAALAVLERLKKDYRLEIEAHTAKGGTQISGAGGQALKKILAQFGVYEKCRENLENGYRVFLLVPERALTGARQNAELIVPGRIAVESIESFVGQNIEELSYFARDKLKHGFRRLIETYNKRVDTSETDKSILVEMPKNL